MPSKLLKTPEVRNWLEQVAEDAALLSAFLAVIQPQLYIAGIRCLTSLSTDPELSDSIGRWGFVYNSAAVIANRCTPFHRDGQSSRADWLDVICSIGGSYDTMLELHSVGIRCQWPGGSVGLFPGRSEIHGVSQSADERLCIALYMLAKVHQRQTIKIATLPHLTDYFVPYYA